MDDASPIDEDAVEEQLYRWRSGQSLHPALLNILRMRQGKGCAYALFLTELLPCVSGKVEFRRHAYRKNISSFASPSDEAFALLVLQNR